MFGTSLPSNSHISRHGGSGGTTTSLLNSYCPLPMVDFFSSKMKPANV